MSIARFFSVILSAFLLVCFVMNKSISSYLEQAYHFHFYPQSEILDEADGFKNKLEQIRIVLLNDEFSANYELLKNLENNKSAENNANLPLNLANLNSAQSPINSHNKAINPYQNNAQNLTANSKNLQNENYQNNAPNSHQNGFYQGSQNLQNAQNNALNSYQNGGQNLQNSTQNNAQISENLPQNRPQFYLDENGIYRAIAQNLPPKEMQKLALKKGEEFLLIGDSLMQGVALALSKDLKALGIKSTNLSKQNTGLAYKGYFDWAKAVQLSFASNENIKYLVVLLGANDPWAIKFEGKFYAFNSDEWRQIYAQRVAEIMQIAREYGVRVLWYEVPPVKRQLLNGKIQILNEIYEQESARNSEIFVGTKEALSNAGQYTSYVRGENNKSVKVRADDGVHFNIKGARIMSDLLLKHLDGGAL